MSCIRNYCIWFTWQDLMGATGASCGGCWELGRGQGLPHTKHSQFQLAPTHPLQGTAEPLSPDGDTSGKAYLRK